MSEEIEIEDGRTIRVHSPEPERVCVRDIGDMFALDRQVLDLETDPKENYWRILALIQ